MSGVGEWSEWASGRAEIEVSEFECMGSRMGECRDMSNERAGE